MYLKPLFTAVNEFRIINVFYPDFFFYPKPSYYYFLHPKFYVGYNVGQKHR